MRAVAICILILIAISCRKQEVCCDIDEVAGVGWPQGSSSYDYTIHSSVDNSYQIVNSEQNSTQNSAQNTEIVNTPYSQQSTGSSAPQLQSTRTTAKIISPEKRYIYTLFSYEITVTNPNTTAIQNITIKHTVPDDVNFSYASDNPQQNGRELLWNVSEIPSNGSHTLKVDVVGQKPGVVKFVADIFFLDNSTLQVESSTVVDASAGLKIDHSDTLDPVEVNTTTIYQIEVTNQGNKDARSLKVINTIPEESELVSAQVKGIDNIKYQLNGKQVVFDTISVLAPEENIVFEIEIKVIDVGDLVNTVEVSTIDFGKTIKSQEGTKSFRE